VVRADAPATGEGGGQSEPAPAPKKRPREEGAPPYKKRAFDASTREFVGERRPARKGGDEMRPRMRRPDQPEGRRYQPAGEAPSEDARPPRREFRERTEGGDRGRAETGGFKGRREGGGYQGRGEGYKGRGEGRERGGYERRGGPREERGERRERGGDFERGGPREERGARGPARGKGGSGVQVYVSAGRAAGIRPQDIMGLMVRGGGVDPSSVGSIDIADRHTIVEVRASDADAAIDAFKNNALRGKKVSASRYRQR
jgi:hypothetical protein